jgi:hypothetical protein
MWAAGALRGLPASTTTTSRRARLSTSAADRPCRAAADYEDVVAAHEERFQSACRAVCSPTAGLPGTMTTLPRTLPSSSSFSASLARSRE